MSSTPACRPSACLQGGTIAYALLASQPEYNNKISVIINMGPVSFLQYFQVPFLKAMAQGEGYNVSAITQYLSGALQGSSRQSIFCSDVGGALQ